MQASGPLTYRRRMSVSNQSRAVDLRVTGTVQGVSYRAACAEQARTLGLVGYVENLDDGAVHLVAEGTPDAVESLVDWCHDGPAAASVDDVEVRDVAPEGYDDFTVRH